MTQCVASLLAVIAGRAKLLVGGGGAEGVEVLEVCGLAGSIGAPVPGFSPPSRPATPPQAPSLHQNHEYIYCTFKKHG